MQRITMHRTQEYIVELTGVDATTWLGGQTSRVAIACITSYALSPRNGRAPVTHS
jgi:hypothetical protein